MEKELENAILKIVEISHTLIEENARLTRDIENLRLRLLGETEKAVEELEQPRRRKGWQVVDPLEGAHFYWQRIPARARRVLKHYKIKGPAGLRDFTVRQIKKVDNAGPVTIEAIRDLAKSYGIELKDR